MTSHLSDQMTDRIIELVRQRGGLKIPSHRRKDIERALASLAVKEDVRGPSQSAQILLSPEVNPSTLTYFISALSIGETYFFRYPANLKLLYKNFLLPLIQKRRKGSKYLRIWSAGCSTGEEPYSLAILLREKIPDWEDWKIEILASDINPDFIEKARRGLYRSWSFRTLPPPLKEKYFQPRTDSTWEIDSQIREAVDFFLLNLIEESYPSVPKGIDHLDLICCSSVLMYFDSLHAYNCLDRFAQCLQPRGVLMTSPVEAGLLSSHPRFTVLEGEEMGCFFQINTSPSEKKKEESDFFREGTWEEERETLWTPPLDLEEESSFWPVAQEGEVAREEEREISFKEEKETLEENPVQEVKEKEERWENEEALYCQVEKLVEEGKTQRALKELENWEEESFSNSRTYYLQGIIYQSQGEREKAVTALKRSLYLNPHDPLVHYTLGNLLCQMGRSQRGDHHLRTARELLAEMDPETLLEGGNGLSAGALNKMILHH